MVVDWHFKRSPENRLSLAVGRCNPDSDSEHWKCAYWAPTHSNWVKVDAELPTYEEAIAYVEVLYKLELANHGKT